MRWAIVLFAVATAGCASQLSYDLGKSDESCHDQQWSSKVALVRCLEAHELPVWTKDEPATLDLYKEFAAARDTLAQQRDQGTLTEQQYGDRLAALEHDVRARITDRRLSGAAPPNSDAAH